MVDDDDDDDVVCFSLSLLPSADLRVLSDIINENIHRSCCLLPSDLHIFT